MTKEELFYLIEEEASYQKLIDALRAVAELSLQWEAKGSYCIPIQDIMQTIQTKLQVSSS